MRCAVILSLAALAVAVPLSQGLDARQEDVSSILAALEAESPEDAKAAKGALNATPAPAPVARAAADQDEEQVGAEGELDTRRTKDAGEDEEEQEQIAAGEEDP